jgi:hypothetical protein
MKHPELGPAKQSFTGVWRLESYSEASNPPTPEPPFDAEPSGILIYTKDGWVSAQLTLPSRGLSDAEFDNSAPSNQLEDLGSSYLAYCGRYHLDFDRSEVIHVPEVASLPYLVNRPQRRRFVFLAPDRLELTAERLSTDSTVLSDHLTWVRSSPSSLENGAVDD